MLCLRVILVSREACMLYAKGDTSCNKKLFDYKYYILMETFHNQSLLYLKFKFVNLKPHRNLTNILEGKIIALLTRKWRKFMKLWKWNEIKVAKDRDAIPPSTTKPWLRYKSHDIFKHHKKVLRDTPSNTSKFKVQTSTPYQSILLEMC